MEHTLQGRRWMMKRCAIAVIVAAIITLPLVGGAFPVRAADVLIVQYPVNAPVGVYGLTRGTDGAFWFVEMDRGDTMYAIVPARIGRLSPAGKLTEYAIPTTTPDLPYDNRVRCRNRRSGGWFGMVHRTLGETGGAGNGRRRN